MARDLLHSAYISALLLSAISFAGCASFPITYTNNGHECYLTSGFKQVCPDIERAEAREKALETVPTNPPAGYRKLEGSLIDAYWAAAAGLDGAGFARLTLGYQRAENSSEFVAHQYVLDNSAGFQAGIDDARQHPDVYAVGLVYLGKYDFSHKSYGVSLEAETPITLAGLDGTGVVVQNYGDFQSIPMDEATAEALRQKLVRRDNTLDPILVVCYGQPKGTGAYVSFGRLLDAWSASGTLESGGVAVPGDVIAGQSQLRAVELQVTQMDIYLPDGTFQQSLKVVASPQGRTSNRTGRSSRHGTY